MDVEKKPASYFCKKIARDPNNTHVFTDAAKRGNMCAIAYVTTKGETNTDLRNCHTVEEAEILAIALAAAHQSEPSRITNIYTDSKKSTHSFGPKH